MTGALNKKLGIPKCALTGTSVTIENLKNRTGWKMSERKQEREKKERKRLIDR